MKITKIDGPIVTIQSDKLRMGEVVHIGDLLAEVVSLAFPETATAQVYGSTAGLRPGMEATPTGAPLSIRLHEGLTGGVYDGLLKPLDGSEPHGKIVPIRNSVSIAEKIPPTVPLVTGVRVIDSLFPIMKGGTCAIPGGFGTGKTSLQHTLARHADVDVVVYIACGERGNEVAEILAEFQMISRCVLIACTSDMPVAVREAGVYTGLAVAEYYRDMGRHVLVLADSTTRWAEAMRELSNRLGEVPAEEGYPTYLAARLAAFYERAGNVRLPDGREASITIVGAVSPAGGDFTEPVTTHTRRFTRCYWALDAKLAHARHYPAINPLASHSAYEIPRFAPLRRQALKTLAEAYELQETIQIAGTDGLSEAQKNTLELARRIKEFTRQNAHDPADAFTPLDTQFAMLSRILDGNPSSV